MRRHSFLVGVNTYEGCPSLTDLNCALADVDAVAEIASDPDFMGPNPNCVKVKNPTLQEAKDAFSEFVDHVERDDVVVFYFTGHGLRNDPGNLYLCFKDSKEDRLEWSALNVNDLGGFFQSKRMHRVLVVLDCCYSGAAGAMVHKDSMRSPINKLETALSDGKGVYVMSSAGETQTAKEGEENSVFTHHLVEGIKSGAADTNGSGEITVEKLARYLELKVPEDAPNQTPMLSSHAQNGKFVVAVNAAAQERRKKTKETARFFEGAEAARKRLAQGIVTKDVTTDFMKEVETWIENNAPSSPIADPKFTAIEDYGALRIGLIQLHETWRSTIPEASKVDPIGPPDDERTTEARSIDPAIDDTNKFILGRLFSRPIKLNRDQKREPRHETVGGSTKETTKSKSAATPGDSESNGRNRSNARKKLPIESRILKHF